MKPEKSGGQRITKGDIRRLARRGGCRRIGSEIYPTARLGLILYPREVLIGFLTDIIRDSVVYTEHAQRSTVQAMDVIYALKRQGRTLLGYE